MTMRKERDAPKVVRGVVIPPRYVPLRWAAAQLGVSPKVASRAAARGQIPAKLLTDGRDPRAGVWVIAARQLSRGENFLRELNPRTGRCSQVVEGVCLRAVADILDDTIGNVYRKAQTRGYALVWVCSKSSRGPRRVAGLMPDDATRFIAEEQARKKKRMEMRS